jgi:MoxR-like ATPase
MNSLATKLQEAGYWRPAVRPLGEKFIKSHDVEFVLNTALRTKKNVILYGPGGYGKSEMVEYALADHRPFVQACGEGMTEEKLFGGIDMPLFKERGEVRYLFENSFMAHRLVVFEELFDAPTNVLLSLKDILTSRRFRQGKEQREIKTEVVIACTNRTPEEVGEDLSSKALLERFPLQHEVKWKSHEAADYRELFQKVLGDDESLGFVAEAIAESVRNGFFISPRTAVHAGEIFLKTGDIAALRFVAGFDDQVVKNLIENKEKLEKIAAQAKWLEEFQAELAGLTEKCDAVETPIPLLQVAKRTEEIIRSLVDTSVYDANQSAYNSVLETAKELADRAQAKALSVTRF